MLPETFTSTVGASSIWFLSTRYSVKIYAELLDLGDFWKSLRKSARVYDDPHNHRE